ncbi:hypothetical protein [Actinoplanes sp. NPDC051494]|uniref:hypothetical protein n=1 Tax=Actinoplanes sp. NPDC051494 TaxID=3363907 RepID=UPI0037935F63
MTDEHAHEVDEAQRRADRFGKLPARVHPDDAVAMTETDPPQDRTTPAGGEDQWMLRVAAG